MHDDGGAKAAKNTLLALGDIGTRSAVVILIRDVVRMNDLVEIAR